MSSREYDRDHISIHGLREGWHILAPTIDDIYKHCPPDQPPIIIGSAPNGLYHHKHDPDFIIHPYSARFGDLDFVVPASALAELENEFDTPATPSRSYPGLQVITVSPDKLIKLHKEWGRHVPTIQILIAPPDITPLEFFTQIALPSESIYGKINPDSSIQLTPLDTTDLSFLKPKVISQVGPIYTAKSVIRYSFANTAVSSAETDISTLSDNLYTQIDWPSLTPDQLESLITYAEKYYMSFDYQHSESDGGSLMRKGSFKLLTAAVLYAHHLPGQRRLLLLSHLYGEITSFLTQCESPTPAIHQALSDLYRGHSTQITPPELVNGMTHLATHYSGSDFANHTASPNHSDSQTFALTQLLSAGRPCDFRTNHLVWKLPFPNINQLSLLLPHNTDTSN